MAQACVEQGVASDGEDFSIAGLCDTVFGEDPSQRRKLGRPNRLLARVLAEHDAETTTPATTPLGDVNILCEESDQQCTLHEDVAVAATHSLALPKVGAQSFWLPAIHGTCALNPIAQELWECRRHFVDQCLSGDAMGGDYAAIFDHYLDNTCYHVASKIMKANELEICKDTIGLKVERLACVQLLLGYWRRAIMESCLSAHIPPAGLLCYVDYSAFDETPMKLSTVSRVSGGHGMHPDVDTMLQLQRRTLKTDTVQAKVLQTHQCFAYMLQIGDRLVQLFGAHTTPLRMMHKGTSDIMLRCLAECSGVTQVSGHFRFKSRCSTSDKDKSNLNSAIAIANARPEGWKGFQVWCDVHTTSTTFVKTYDFFMSSDVSGLLHLSLALRHGSSLAGFRQSLEMEVEQRLKIMQGYPPQAAMEHKRLMMKILMSGESFNDTHRVLMLKVVNGDWRNAHDVEYYPECNRGGPTTRSDISKMVASALLCCLVAHKPVTWPRHRWHGAEVATEEVLRLEVVHKLLTHTWSRFMKLFEKKQKKTTSAFGASGLLAVQVGEVDGCGADHDNHMQNEQIEGRDSGATDVLHAVSPDPLLERLRSSADHSQDRQKATEWLKSGPSSKLLIMRYTMQPLMEHLFAQFKIASEEWEVEQRSKLLQQGNHGNVCARDYPLSLAAAQVLEKSYFEKLGGLFTSQVYAQLVPEGDWTCYMRSLIFKLLARQGALILQLQVRDHSQFPIKLFECLVLPDKGAELANMGVCFKDPWTKEMQRLHPSFTGDQFLQTLALHAQLVATNIAVQEARHASTRRHAMQKSNQTWTAQFSSINAEWLCQQMRRTKYCLLSPHRRVGKHSEQRKQTKKVPSPIIQNGQ
eukprot:2501537-Amphidinium_carterae.2